MSRVKGGMMAMKRRRNILAQVKGYRFGRSTKKRQAIEALHHAYNYSFAHRKDKKNDFRRLWVVRINAALRTLGMTWSTYTHAASKKSVAINRKMLADLALNNPSVFEKIVATVK
ncbi:50S ribosomal protein L20 [Candidatus Kaiserbacteria bacterium RIFCSPHIGHO2_02_FULL_49_34]|uniref:Large ribosomal subunit protein bL20 n=1 Tax=Candidatus Kaiserbacteria bacterium RIFCSPHIGHO2_02_FULL_49_34 TaxID=1798491 RepID=A0A1F6DJ34_9BACT|nr:MAG: 50S ribosomal protein L20 [Candidatus Kaiserbacteria bacterium RIFCSPHIGHO2_02_FULL_49_34]